MRMASRLRWPWLVIGSAPPVDSIVISDQIIPVEISTDATCKMAMLSSVLPKRWRLTRLTCSGVTTMRTGKNTFPRVQRLAVKVSLGDAGVVDMLPFRALQQLALQILLQDWRMQQGF